MSPNWEDMMHDAMADAYYSDLDTKEVYEEMRRQVLDEFKSDLLRAYYLAKPEIPQQPLAMLNEARALLGNSPAAVLALACSSIELTVKNLILRPLVHGVIHQDSVADLVANLTLGHAAMDRFRDLLFGILNEFVGIDLKTYSRPGTAVTLWEEIRTIQGSRNAVLHRGDPASPDAATQAVAIAEHILQYIFQQTIGKFGFTMDCAGRIQPPPLKVKGPVV